MSTCRHPFRLRQTQRKVSLPAVFLWLIQFGCDFQSGHSYSAGGRGASLACACEVFPKTRFPRRSPKPSSPIIYVIKFRWKPYLRCWFGSVDPGISFDEIYVFRTTPFNWIKRLLYILLAVINCHSQNKRVPHWPDLSSPLHEYERLPLKRQV